jgi:uncharacterized surface protein with fasciclin (FAS1) repeats
MPDDMDNVGEAADINDGADPIADAGNEGLDPDETTMPVEDPELGMIDAGDTTDDPDTQMPVVDPDAEVTDPDAEPTDPDNETVEPAEPIEPTDELVNDPGDNVPAPVDETIARALLEFPDYQILLTLIEQVDLTLALDGDNDGQGWTLFAFSDIAYENENLMTVTDELTEALVKRHIFSGRLMFSDIIPGMLGMTQGIVDVVQNDDGSITIGGARVVARDRVFSNGIIHFVDSVLDEF